jgi:hypothetical protein
MKSTVPEILSHWTVIPSLNNIITGGEWMRLNCQHVEGVHPYCPTLSDTVAAPLAVDLTVHEIVLLCRSIPWSLDKELL